MGRGWFDGTTEWSQDRPVVPVTRRLPPWKISFTITCTRRE